MNESQLKQVMAAPRIRTFVLLAVFCGVFVLSLVFIRPINTFDYDVTQRAFGAFLTGRNPYDVEVLWYMPPWSLWLLAPVALLPLSVWLAFDLAILVTLLLDLGNPAAFLFVIHPATITLIASGNPEWLLVGPGLWLIFHDARGELRALGWLLLACKPQTTVFLLAYDGFQALRQRDWRAFLFGIIATIAACIPYLTFVTRLAHPFEWSASVAPHTGYIVAIILALGIAWLRRKMNGRDTALLLAPILSPYMLQYSLVSVLFAVRHSGWLTAFSITLFGMMAAVLFWQDYHVREWLGTAVIVVSAVLISWFGTSLSLPLMNDSARASR